MKSFLVTLKHKSKEGLPEQLLVEHVAHLKRWHHGIKQEMCWYATLLQKIEPLLTLYLKRKDEKQSSYHEQSSHHERTEVARGPSWCTIV